MQNTFNSFPDKLLDQINEHTTGGFVIFFTNKDGQPEYIPYTDNEVILRGLISYIIDAANGLQILQRRNVEFYVYNGDDSDENGNEEDEKQEDDS